MYHKSIAANPSDMRHKYSISWFQAAFNDTRVSYLYHILNTLVHFLSLITKHHDIETQF